MVFIQRFAAAVPLLALSGIFVEALPAEIDARSTTSAVKPEISVITTTSGSDVQQIIPGATNTTLVRPSYSTKLDTQGNPSLLPFPTSVPSATAPLHLSTSAVAVQDIKIQDVTPTTAAFSNSTGSGNFTAEVTASGASMFAAIATDAPPAQFTQLGTHPVHRTGIMDSDDLPIETNKFYSNFYLDDRDWTTWIMPYMVRWTNGHTVSGTFGLTVSHTTDAQRVYGPDATEDPVEYYINPSNLEDITFGATEFVTDQTNLTMDTLKEFFTNVNLVDQSGNNLATFPFCRGSGLITGLYNDITPQILTGNAFSSITNVATSQTGLTKYEIVLSTGITWLLYATATDASGFTTAVDGNLNLTIANNTQIIADNKFHGIIQLAKIPLSPPDDAETLYDAQAGQYCSGLDLDGSVTDSSASYTFNFEKSGVTSDTGLLMYALPHQVASFDGVQTTDMGMISSTHGNMMAVVADSWTMTETDLATDVGFLPWSPAGAPNTWSADTLAKIQLAAEADVAVNFSSEADLNSMYYAGKALSKQATICYVVNDILKNATLATTCLEQLKTAFAIFSSNQQIFPLVYDTVWKGLVSSAVYTTGDPNQDFGNSNYNDHHFHYGYHVHAAAVIAYLDSTWLTDDNKAYVTALIRDFANPSSDDPYFPVQRSFDWFVGHSWAKGLFSSADGKDQESGSEDYFATYGMKMWAHVVGDTNMEARANLMLAVQKRSLNSYFLLADGNDNHPANFEPNMVSGILFEGKVDCTTYFGMNLEYIHGIQMIPLSPISPYIRPTDFVQQEWTKFFDTYVDSVVGGWRGLLKANQAIIDPAASYDFFSQDNFDQSFLDGGASLTWYLAWTAGLGGAS